jgi:hypothetical protein
MAKKTSIQDLKGVIKLTPTYTLTKDQVKQLSELSSELYSIKGKLGDLEGEDSISTIMFNIGSAYEAIGKVETQLDEIADLLQEQREDDEELF